MKRLTTFAVALFATIVSIQAQPITETMNEKAVLQYGNMKIEMECHLDIPDGEEPLQRNLTLLLFGNENPSVKEAYNAFFKNWKGKRLNPQQEVGGFRIETIMMSIHKEYEKTGRFSCFHVKAKMTPTTSNDAKASAAQKTLLNRFKAEINKFFIYDLQKHEVMGLDKILGPVAFEKISSAMGDDVNLYAEDWCLWFSSAKGEGRFLINATTEKYYTDYFKELTQWQTALQDCATPQFLRGEKGMRDFFIKEGKYSYAADGEPADTVKLNLTIGVDGGVESADVASSASKYDAFAMQMCRKMPKWRPAYQDGNAVTSTAQVAIPFLNEIGDEIPEFPDDDREFRRRLFEDLKIPSDVGLKEKVSLEIIIEKDGSVTYVGTKGLANEYLKRQFIERLTRMPKWKPAKMNGKTVRFKMSLPIKLSFTDDPNYLPDY